MKKKSTKRQNILPEYDFRSGVRGKYTKRYKEGSNIVVLDRDVAEFFPNPESVNDALRAIAKVIKQHEKAHLHS